MVSEGIGGPPAFGTLRLRVDILEEDASLRRALGRLLTGVGLRSSGYSSVQSYLEAGEMASAACLLLDLHTPGLSVDAFMEHLRETAPDLPVICMTHRDEPVLQRQFVDAGVGVCLRKPFDQTELFRAIADVATFYYSDQDECP